MRESGREGREEDLKKRGCMAHDVMMGRTLVKSTCLSVGMALYK